MTAPHPALRATLSPQAGRGATTLVALRPACGEKVAEGRMRGVPSIPSITRGIDERALHAGADRVLLHRVIESAAHDDVAHRHFRRMELRVIREPVARAAGRGLHGRG